MPRRRPRIVYIDRDTEPPKLPEVQVRFEERVPNDILVGILRKCCELDRDSPRLTPHDDETVTSDAISALHSASLVCRRWGNACRPLRRQYVRLTSHSHIINYGHTVVRDPGLALQARHLHAVVEPRGSWGRMMEYEEYEYRDQIREARAICFSALLSIVRACKNLESLKTDGVVGDLNSEWACGIAELPKLNHLAIDFGGTDHLELDTISRLGRSSAKNIYIERFWGLGVKGTPLDELPRTPAVLDSQDVALSAPREKRGIVLSLQCCRLSHRELDVVLTHLTQGHNGRLGSVHLGGAVYPHRIDAGGSINLNRLLKRFGSGVKELTVDDPWRWTAGGSELVAGVSGLASVCPNLEKVEFGQDELDYWAKVCFRRV